MSNEQTPKTVRQQIIDLLIERDMSANELSRAIGVREKEVATHLNHIGRSAAAKGKTLIIRPFQCLSCGYMFTERKRFTRPGRCPQCKSTHLEAPTFRII